MATFTWLGKSGLHTDPDDATDPLNWVGGILPQPGDTIIVPAGTAPSPVALDVTGQPGAPEDISSLAFAAAGPFDSINLTNTVITDTTITAGNGAAAGQGFVLSLTDSTADATTITIGNNATLALSGSTATATRIASDSGQSTITEAATGGALTINATGTASLDAQLWLRAPGGQTVVNIAQSGTLAGFLHATGAILNLGGTLTINGDANTGTRFSNAGYMLIDGAPGAALTRLNARMNSISGEITLLGAGNTATLDVNTNMSGAQIVNFADTTGVLRIEAGTVLGTPFTVSGTPTTVLQNFFSRITGFQPGDTIELAGLDPTGLTYAYGNDPDYGKEALIISRGTAVLARMRFISTNLVAGTGTIDGAATGNFQLTSAGGSTLITLANTRNVVNGSTTIAVTGTLAHWNGVTNGATTDWSAANWTGGTGPSGLPGQYQTTQITLTASEAATVAGGDFPRYVLSVASAEQAGAVTFDDPLAQLVIAAPLTLAALPGQAGGGGFTAGQGKVTIDPTGTLSTSRAYFGHGADLSIAAGGHLAISGAVGFTLGSGLAGLDMEGSGTVAGGTIASTGNIVVGQNGNAALSVSNGAQVTASYTQIGGSALTGADPVFTVLDISGPQTSWTDAGGDASTPLSGAMIVGGGNLSLNGLGGVSFPAGGVGQLNVQDGATLTESSFAMLAATRTSTGMVNIGNGARWTIGSDGATLPDSIIIGDAVTGSATLWTGGLPWLTVGAGGTGTLAINSGVVQLGTGEAFNDVKIIIGGGSASNNQATGSVDVTGTGALLDSGGGPIVVGQRSAGILTIGNGGTVNVGAAAATTAIGFGLAIGNRSGTVGASSGLVSIATGGVLLDDGDLVVGRDSAGTLALPGGLATVSGGLYLGGLRSLSNGTIAISPTLFRGAATGTVNVTTGTLNVAGGIADMWQGSTLALNGTGAIAIGATPLSGGLVVGSNAVLQGAGLISISGAGSTLRNNGTVIAGGLTSGGTLSQAGATLEIAAVLAGGGTYQIAQSALLQIDSAAPTHAQFAFTGASAASGTIRVAVATTFQGTIGGLYGTGHHIDLLGATISPGGTLSYTANLNPITGGTIALPTTQGQVSFGVTGYHPGGFALAPDASGGLLVTANDAAPCFAAGTMILTTTGERPVESLRPGDLVPVLGGRIGRVVWTGRTRIDLARHAAPHAVAPIRIRAGALGDALPHRDLVVSPDHALWTDGVLVPAYLLVNDATIRREPAAGTVLYVHVELDRHALLLAEGTPAETYLDTGNRGLFAGNTGPRQLHPDLVADISARAWDERACATLSLGGPGVAAAHRRIAARAAQLGYKLTDDPDLHIIAGDDILLPQPLSGNRIRVHLPAGTTTICLASRHAMPRAGDATSDDRRTLGIAIAAASLAGQPLPLEGSCWVDGVHPPERAGTTTFRWTNGNARLALPPSPRRQWLELTLLPGLLRYPLEPDAGTSAAVTPRAWPARRSPSAPFPAIPSRR